MNASPLWLQEKTPVPYLTAVEQMQDHVDRMITGLAREKIWLLEHPPVYTVGTSGHRDDLKDIGGVPVYQTGRGGQVTYHGPGQRILYVMLDLKKRGLTVQSYMHALEGWIIDTLSHLKIQAKASRERIGIWVDTEKGEAKIAAFGIRIRKGICFHGAAINVSPDLGAFERIVPCGLRGFGVTSCEKLRGPISLERLDQTLFENCPFL